MLLLPLLLACASPPVQPLDPEPTVPARVDADRLARDLAFVARPRPPGSPHWKAVQQACADRFAAAGLEVRHQRYDTGVNIVGRREGTSAEQVVLVAHYGHIPGCAGADDNATGVSGLWALADAVAPGDRTLVLACVDQEEWGLIGARALAARTTDPVHAMISVEMIGFTDDTPGAQKIPPGFDWAFQSAYAEVEARAFRGDFLFYVGDHRSAHVGRALRAGGQAAGVPVIGFTSRLATWVPDLERSDHAAFWLHDLPGVMATDTANFRYPNYHCVNGPDDVRFVDREFHTRSVEALVHATEALLAR